jgi:hypothetical protein
MSKTFTKRLQAIFLFSKTPCVADKWSTVQTCKGRIFISLMGRCNRRAGRPPGRGQAPPHDRAAFAEQYQPTLFLILSPVTACSI